jgi:hypothetical protein
MGLTRSRTWRISDWNTTTMMIRMTAQRYWRIQLVMKSPDQRARG